MDNKLSKYYKKDMADILDMILNGSKEESSPKYYPGKVVDNNDPDRLGRCRIRVYSIYSSEIPDSDLPWAIPENTFIGSTKGSFIVPPNDALVKVYFEDDCYYQPKYTSKVLHESKLKDFESDIYDDYPDTMVFFESDEGDYFKINRRSREATYKSASGTFLKIDSQGNVTIDTTASREGSFKVLAKGDIELNTRKTLTLSALQGLDFKSIGLSAWQPNILPVDPMTGIPHSLPNVGITTLKGSEPI